MSLLLSCYQLMHGDRADGIFSSGSPPVVLSPHESKREGAENRKEQNQHVFVTPSAPSVML